MLLGGWADDAYVIRGMGRGMMHMLLGGWADDAYVIRGMGRGMMHMLLGGWAEDAYVIRGMGCICYGVGVHHSKDWHAKGQVVASCSIVLEESLSLFI